MSHLPQFTKIHKGKTQKSPIVSDDHILHRLAFDNAAQASIIFNVQNGQILAANKSAWKLLGYSKKELMLKGQAQIFETSETAFVDMLRQRQAEGKSGAKVNLIKKNGKHIFCEITSAVFNDEDGIEKSITTFTDLTQRILDQKIIDDGKEKKVALDIYEVQVKQKETNIKNGRIIAGNIASAKAIANSRQIENTEWIKEIAKTSYDVMWDWNITTGKIYVGESIETVFGYKVENNSILLDDLKNNILSSEKYNIEEKLSKVLSSARNNWKDAHQIKKSDGSIAFVTSRATIIRDPAGKAVRLIGATQDVSVLDELERKLKEQEIIMFEAIDDITRQKDLELQGSLDDHSKEEVLEERLELEIKLKEKQIADAMEDAKETERSEIGRELHDNVNQLLGISKLFLDMAKRGGANTEMYLNRCSEYNLSAIEAIRELTKNLTTDVIKNLGLVEAIEILVKDTMEVNPLKISCELSGFDESKVNDKFKLNIFRIVQEQLNNILKHAQASNIFIHLSQNNDSVNLELKDDGIGFDTTKKHAGIGIDNIRNRAKTFNGKAEFISHAGQGSTLKVEFAETH